MSDEDIKEFKLESGVWYVKLPSEEGSDIVQWSVTDLRPEDNKSWKLTVKDDIIDLSKYFFTA